MWLSHQTLLGYEQETVVLLEQETAVLPVYL